MKNIDTIEDRVSLYATELYDESYKNLCKDNDFVYAGLLLFQWIGSVLIALIISPRTWIGQTNQVHIHVIAATLIGGLLSVPPIYLNLKTPGAVKNRYINVIA